MSEVSLQGSGFRVEISLEIASPIHYIAIHMEEFDGFVPFDFEGNVSTS